MLGKSNPEEDPMCSPSRPIGTVGPSIANGRRESDAEATGADILLESDAVHEKG